MKKGTHPHKKLSPRFIGAVKEAGKYHDGNGLRLIVVKNGYKQWKQRLTVKGTGKRIELGGFGAVGSRPLGDVRQMALDNLNLARSGINPKDERSKPVIKIPTFEEVGRAVWNEEKKNFKNEKHIKQWIKTLEDYVFPKIGNKTVDQVTPGDAIRVLNPIWLEKKETADRVRMRMSKVMKRAKFLKYRPDNPLDDIKETLAKQNKKVNSFEALPYQDIQSFIKQLRSSDMRPVEKLAAEFLVQTCLRNSPVREAEWSEIDLKARAWNIPADKMKADRAFSVPLTDRAIEILEELKEYSGESQWLFPQARNPRKYLDENVIRKVVQSLGFESMNGKRVTAHGFRTTARGWADEKTNYSFKVKEAVLSHVEKDKTVAAYSRSTLFDERREFLNTWSAYIDPADENVVHINKGSA